MRNNNFQNNIIFLYRYAKIQYKLKCKYYIIHVYIYIYIYRIYEKKQYNTHKAKQQIWKNNTIQYVLVYWVVGN